MAKAFPKTWTRNIKQDGAWPKWSIELYKNVNGVKTPLTTGFSAKSQVKKSADSTTAEKEFTLGYGLLITGNVLSYYGVADLPIRSYVIDLEVTDDSTGIPEYTGTAVITIDPNITE